MRKEILTLQPRIRATSIYVTHDQVEAITMADWIVFFFNDPATTEIYTAQYTLSLHDALPICHARRGTSRPVSRDESHPPARRGPLLRSRRGGRGSARRRCPRSAAARAASLRSTSGGGHTSSSRPTRRARPRGREGLSTARRR